MIVPRYWSRSRQVIKRPGGESLPLEVVSGSAVSLEDAAEKARAKLQRLIQRVMGGQPLPDQQYYAAGDLREEIKREIFDESGRTRAIVTRNGYGALVLNAAETMFVDIDMPEPPASGLGGLMGRLFGRNRPSAPDPFQIAFEKVDLFLRNYPEWGFRIYRTHSGLRLLAIHDLFDPAAEPTLGWMRELGCDPLYLRLCKGQGSFRARLTPKPWRCGGFLQPPTSFPWRDPAAEARHRAWEREYEARIAKYKTCELIGVRGAAEVHPEVAPIVAIHDAETLRDGALPLA